MAEIFQNDRAKNLHLGMPYSTAGQVPLRSRKIKQTKQLQKSRDKTRKKNLLKEAPGEVGEIADLASNERVM